MSLRTVLRVVAISGGERWGRGKSAFPVLDFVKNACSAVGHTVRRTTLAQTLSAEVRRHVDWHYDAITGELLSRLNEPTDPEHFYPD